MSKTFNRVSNLTETLNNLHLTLKGDPHGVHNSLMPVPAVEGEFSVRYALNTGDDGLHQIEELVRTIKSVLDDADCILVERRYKHRSTIAMFNPDKYADACEYIDHCYTQFDKIALALSEILCLRLYDSTTHTSVNIYDNWHSDIASDFYHNYYGDAWEKSLYYRIETVKYVTRHESDIDTFIKTEVDDLVDTYNVGYGNMQHYLQEDVATHFMWNPCLVPNVTYRDKMAAFLCSLASETTMIRSALSILTRVLYDIRLDLVTFDESVTQNTIYRAIKQLVAALALTQKPHFTWKCIEFNYSVPTNVDDLADEFSDLREFFYKVFFTYLPEEYIWTGEENF